MLGRIRHLIRRILPNNGLARGATVLASGTAVGQVVLLLASPLLTRLYTPADLGLLAVFVGLLALAGTVSSLRYEIAIPLPLSDQQAGGLAKLSLLILVASSLVSALILLILHEEIAQLMNLTGESLLLLFLPMGILFSGAYSIFTYWSIRVSNYPKMASTQIQRTLVTTAIQFLAFRLGALGLIFGQTLGQGIGTFALAKPALRHEGFRSSTWTDMREAFVRYRRFPLFSTWSGLANTVGLQAPVLLFAALYGPAVVGAYALAQRVLQVPASVIGSAVGQVFFGAATTAHRDGRLNFLVLQIFSKLTDLGLPIALVTMLVGPRLFSLVFGPAWQQAGEFAQLLAPWLLLVFIGSPLTKLFPTLERQSQGLVFQIVLLLARAAAILIGSSFFTLAITVGLFSLASVTCWLGFFIWVSKATGVRFTLMAMRFLSSLLLSLLLVIPILLGTVLGNYLSMGWLLGTCVSAALISIRYMSLFRGIAA